MKVVLFHTNCTDGLFAAYAAWRKFGKDALYIPVNYKPIQDLSPTEALNYIFSEETGKKIDGIGNSHYKTTDIKPEMYKDIELLIVDYSFPVDHFIEHCKLFKSVTVLDHHEKAINDYCAFFYSESVAHGWKRLAPYENAELLFSEKESGAKLTWMYFHPNTEIPKTIELVSDRDLFTFHLEQTRSFAAGIRGIGEKNFSKLHKLVTEDFEELIVMGGHFERANVNRVAATRESNTKLITVKLDGVEHKAAIVNSFPDIASDLCANVIKNFGCSIAIAYNIYNGDNVGCSIRSNNKTALPISEKLGGGGHGNAAGFHIDLQRLTNILTTGILEV